MNPKLRELAEQMKADSHFDPLRPVLRQQSVDLRSLAERIDRYLSSPAQASIDALMKFDAEIARLRSTHLREPIPNRRYS